MEQGNHGINFGGIEGLACVLSGAIDVAAAALVMEDAAVLRGEAQGVQHLGGVRACPGEPEGDFVALVLRRNSVPEVPKVGMVPGVDVGLTGRVGRVAVASVGGACAACASGASPTRV